MIINHTEPDDFVVSTGRTHSVGDMCNYVFSKLGMVSTDFITQDPRFMRAEELKYLKGDCSKIKKVLGWKPEYTFEEMMDEMIEHWMELYG